VERRIDIVDGDDWEGLFFDGHLLEQDHGLGLVKMLTLLSTRIGEGDTFVVKSHSCDLDWLDGLGRFPSLFKDVKLMG